MKSSTLRGFLAGICAIITSVALASAQPTVTKTATKTGTTVTTSQLEGTVLAVDGNTLLVKMSTGEVREVVAAADRTALIDGKEVAAKDLKVGTKLKATITTTTASITDRTVTVGSGKVWYVAGNNVILTHPNGENHQYKVKDDYKFIVDGKPATVFDLKKGMTVSAEKIVEEPRTVVTSNTRVTGEAPGQVKTETASTAAAIKPAPVPPPAKAPAPASKPAPAPEPAAAPASLPATASPLPLIGLAGALLAALSLGVRSLRRGR